MDDLLQEFIAETREMLGAIAGELVAWEADPADRARLDEVFRFVHTVKGSCGFLDLPRLARLSHAAEDVLGALRDGTRLPDATLVSAVLGVVDRIGELADAIETGASLPDDEDQILIAALSDAPENMGRPAASATVREPVARTVARSVRLPVDLLDRMMGGVSDMVLARNELARRLREAGGDGAVQAAFERLSASVAEMRDAITRTRMQRIDTVFSAMPRLVRDLSAELGKPVMLELDGGDVELDREMIEMIRDPLIHIIRNAIDHGIEPPAARRAAGKPVTARLMVSARQAGNQILIDIADDGRGIDGDKVAQRAVAGGIVTRDRVDRLSRQQKVELIFEPGLSTADTVTAISGRGVGMDVVRANIERIGGRVEIDSRPSLGLRISLRVPLTLAIIPALTVSAGAQRFAIPRASIEEIVRATGDAVRIEPIGGGEMAMIRGRRLPMIRLAALLDLPDEAPAAPILVVLRSAGATVFALALDAVHDHEELVVKPAAPALMAAGVYAGTTLPDNGQPMLLLDPAGLADAAGVPAAAPEPEAVPERQVPGVPTLLFEDLDGTRRGIRLAVVERIEDVAAGAIELAAGHMRIVRDGRILPLLACRSTIAPGRATVLRLGDGTIECGYAIARVIDICDVAAAVAPAAVAGLVAGVVLVAGRQTELLDPYWLFGEAARAAPAAAAGRPLALLGDPADSWTREVLRPLVEQAGYRVGFVGGGDRADIIIGSGSAVGDAPIDHSLIGDVPVIRLRADAAPDADPDSIYRYDREALLRALQTRAGGGRDR